MSSVHFGFLPSQSPAAVVKCSILGNLKWRFLSVSAVFTAVKKHSKELARITNISVSETAVPVTVSVRNDPV